MALEEITLENLIPEEFIKEKIQEISSIAGDDFAINALSGGVDSSTVTMLGDRALGNRLLTYFVDNGLMRENEPKHIVSLFNGLGIYVELIDAKDIFFNGLKGLTDPEKKREKGITQPFYKEVFGKLVKKTGAKYLLQGTNYIDIEETVAGVKRQHNVFEQIGINPEQAFGYKIIEPLIQLRKPAIRKVAEYLSLPEEIYNRQPFPGPALAIRVIGEVTPEKIEIVRKATKIVEEIIENESLDPKPFQYLAILHEDKITGIRNGKRDFGNQIEVRCWNSKDAATASPTILHHNTLLKLSRRITTEVPGVVSVTYNITEKPTSTIEAI